MTEYFKRDPAGVPQDVQNAILTGQAYKAFFGDGKTGSPLGAPSSALASAAWSVCGPELLEAVKLAYRKHHLGDDSIGWDELSEALHNALCNAMGDKAYLAWMDEITDGA